MVVALGLSGRLVGISVHDQLPDAEHLERVADLEVDYEKLLALRPDLVLTDPNFLDPGPRMQELGLETLEISVKRVAEFPAALRTLGERLGAVAAAEKRAADFEEQLEQLRKNGESIGNRPKVLILIWTDPPMVAGGNSFLGDVLRVAGGQNVFEELAGYPTVSEEQLVARPAELVIMSDELGALPRSLKQVPVLRLEADAFSRPGLTSLRTIEAIQQRMLEQ